MVEGDIGDVKDDQKVEEEVGEEEVGDGRDVSRLPPTRGRDVSVFVALAPFHLFDGVFLSFFFFFRVLSLSFFFFVASSF